MRADLHRRLRYPREPFASAWHRARPGFLHIGGVRTFLFNWLFARQQGGEYLLRIENTDTTREVAEAVDQIQRVAAVARDRLGRRADVPARPAGRLPARRRAARRRGQGVRGRGRDPLPHAGRRRNRVGRRRPGPRRGSRTRRSRISCSCASDGRPTYNFASPMEDMWDGITHVIRGDDHISNTPKQINIIRAVGARAFPCTRTCRASSARREEALEAARRRRVDEFRDAGYLPEAMVNFLALLGWAPDGETTIMSRDELIERFTLERVSPSPAQFDYAKLDWMNGMYLRALPPDEFAHASIAWLGEHGYDWDAELVRKAAPLVQEKIARLDEFPGSPAFSSSDVDAIGRRGGRRRARRARRARGRSSRSRAEAIEAALRGVARAPRPEAASGLPADPRRRDGLDGLARPVREHRAARPRDDARAARPRGGSGLGRASGSSARWKTRQACRRYCGDGAGRSYVAASFPRRTGIPRFPVPVCMTYRGNERLPDRGTGYRPLRGSPGCARRRGRAVAPAPVPDQPRARGLRRLRGVDARRGSGRGCGSATSRRAPRSQDRARERGGLHRRAARANAAGTRCARYRLRGLRVGRRRARGRVSAQAVHDRRPAINGKATRRSVGSRHVDDSGSHSGGVRSTPAATTTSNAPRRAARFASARRRCPSRRRSSPGTRISSRAIRSTRCAGRRTRRRARSANACIGCGRRARAGSSPPSSRPSRMRSRTRSSARASTFKGEEMPLRAAQARLAVLDSYADREELGNLERTESAKLNPDRLELLAVAEELERRVTGEPDPVARAEEEKAISLRELERALVAARRRDDRAVRAMRDRWFDRILGTERDASRRAVTSPTFGVSRRSSRRTRRSGPSPSAWRRRRRSASTSPRSRTSGSTSRTGRRRIRAHASSPPIRPRSCT